MRRPSDLFAIGLSCLLLWLANAAAHHSRTKSPKSFVASVETSP